jgi:L-asparaginase
MRIQFITTGGTIDKVYFDAMSDYRVGPPPIAEILRDAHVTFEFDVEMVLAKDSLDLTDADRRLICDRVAASACQRIVVTHGTDTMVTTARCLKAVPGKTIVLTGSMQPARFRNTDALFNLGTAIAAVQTLPPGVYLAMNGRIFDPDRARKNREKGCFEAQPGE